MLKNKLIKQSLVLIILFVLLAIILFDDTSLWFLGMSLVATGIISLYLINH